MQVSADAMLDIQVKRIHEYKRQLLNVLGIIHRYDTIRNMSPEQRKQVLPHQQAPHSAMWDMCWLPLVDLSSLLLRACPGTAQFACQLMHCRSSGSPVVSTFQVLMPTHSASQQGLPPPNSHLSQNHDHS